MRRDHNLNNEYDFFPQTYILPQEYNDLKKVIAQNNKQDFYIVKPEALCQGRGIFLCRDLQDIAVDDHYVVQDYVADPHLLDGLKYDLRIYVLLYGINPLRIFLFEDGLVRLATEPYTEPNDMN